MQGFNVCVNPAHCTQVEEAQALCQAARCHFLFGALVQHVCVRACVCACVCVFAGVFTLSKLCSGLCGLSSSKLPSRGSAVGPGGKFFGLLTLKRKRMRRKTPEHNRSRELSIVTECLCVVSLSVTPFAVFNSCCVIKSHTLPPMRRERGEGRCKININDSASLHTLVQV